MKKRLILLFLTAACAAAMLAGCKKSVGTPEDNAVVEETDTEENTEEDQESGRLFGYSCIDLSNPFYETLTDSIQNSLKEQGDRILVKDPASDVNVQIQQIQEMIEADVDAVFLCPVDWEAITPALEALDEADIPVINLDTEVKETDLVDAFVGSDNHNAGYICGEDLVAQKPDGGRIAIIENPGINAINERITGFEEAIVNAGFEVVTRIKAGSELSVVKEEMLRVLSENEQLDAVMCGNDQMAEQVLKALDEAERTDVLVYSVDGSPVTKSAMKENGSGMAGIGAQSPINMGKIAVKVATALLNGEDYEKETYEETFLITRDNVDMYGTDGWQ